MNRFFTLLLAALCLTAVGQVPDYVPTDGLVAWLNLDADGIDELGSYSALLVGGHESSNRYGSCGGAIGLDYSGAYNLFGDHLELGSIPDIAYATDLSIGIWFNADVSQQVGQGEHNMLWSSGRNQLYLSLRDDGLIQLGGSGFCSEIGNLVGQEAVASNVWHHVVAIVRDSTLELWFDGELVEQDNAPVVLCNADQFWIGSMYGYAPHGFVGDLDEFGIWGRSLLADEVVALYESQLEGSGCTDFLACNYDETAVIDDGSCVSCDVLALACGTGTIWDPISQTCIVDESTCSWQPDGNGDDLIGVSDLLDLLGVYGDTDYDQDGIWDSADDCVGEYDECGVCNGSGPSIPIIESIEILYDSVYAEQIDEWWVFEVGSDTTYNYVCEAIEGCTDPDASNYAESANVEDNSCLYVVLGCTDPSACNFNTLAELDDDSCEGQLGCTDPLSTNFSSAATCDDESCAPYVGMYAFGGVVLAISGNNLSIVNIDEEPVTGPLVEDVQAALVQLETNGYDDWYLPSSSQMDLMCEHQGLINLVASQNGGLQFDGWYVKSWLAHGDYMYSGNSFPTCWSCNGVFECEPLSDMKLRALRTQTIGQ